MSGAIDANAKPLPVVLKAARDELLSSWLARHARFYGVTGPFFAKWLGLGDIRLSDARLSPRLGASRSIDGKVPVRSCDADRHDAYRHAVTVRFATSSAAAGHRKSATPVRIATLKTARKAPFQNIGARRGELHAPPAASPLRTRTEHRGSRATLFETTPFEDLWSEAVAGEQIVERYLADGKPAEHSPIAVLQLLLVQTWKPITGDLEHPVVGWVLGTLFPNFDVRARPIKRRVTHMLDSLSSDRIPAGAARRAGARIGQSGGAPGSTQGNPSAGSTELRQILPGGEISNRRRPAGLSHQ